jgi:hypothetical protein
MLHNTCSTRSDHPQTLALLAWFTTVITCYITVSRCNSKSNGAEVGRAARCCLCSNGGVRLGLGFGGLASSAATGRRDKQVCAKSISDCMFKALTTALAVALQRSSAIGRRHANTPWWVCSWGPCKLLYALARAVPSFPLPLATQLLLFAHVPRGREDEAAA